ncbi:DUF2147 domain-containing protein [Parvularcula dongshanensis]|uniref:Uncharacterized protein (DUF2147 family) n=1 Tax=Parvularcula dongshanensis TaxID=1173995 RepID=A0A840I1Q2_9PROT|nr:DUF2147 domain-containing protein [Parvularcula dongshanensis]MBB4658211.1 uncharacterized protein (DUF2147 family) [Parvularcula dongshanensis]
MLSLLIGLTQAVQGPLDVYGDWVVEGGRGTVTIARCASVPEAQDGTPCGVLTSVPAEAGPEGQEVIGARLLWGFEEDGQAWGGGRILDPEEDKTYRSKIWREGGTLQVKGCLGPFCKTQVWTPAGSALE